MLGNKANRTVAWMLGSRTKLGGKYPDPHWRSEKMMPKCVSTVQSMLRALVQIDTSVAG
jgi:hypothetical protein